MAEFQLNAETRTIVGKKVNQLRRDKIVPGSIYGPETEPVKIQMPYRELELTLMHAGGTNLIDVKAGSKSYAVLAREVQRDVLRGDILHVDFFAVNLKKKIAADVQIVIQGTNPVVLARKAILITGPNSVSVEMLPSRMIDRIVIDVSVLKEIGDTIYVRDLDLPDTAVINNDPEEMIAKLVQPSSARALERLEAMDAGLIDEDGEIMEPEIIGEETDEEGEGEEDDDE